MQIKIDTKVDSPADIRAVIGFLAHIYHLEPSDLDHESNAVPEGTTRPKDFQDVSSRGASAAGIPVAPQPAVPVPATLTRSDNVVNFPVPPPPAPLMFTSTEIAAIAGANAAVSALAPTAVAVTAVASAQTPRVPAEYDSAGMPWDGRIHQRGKAQKKDGTWKLQKGIDQTIVQSVVMELSARKVATPQSPSVGARDIRTGETVAIPVMVPPPPPLVTLPAGPLLPGNTVPLPPVTVESAPAYMPAPPAPAPVPVPPIAPVGTAVTYRSLIDKMTAGHQSRTLTLEKMLDIVKMLGCPNMQELNHMPQIWPDVDAKLDLVLAGLM